MFSAYSTEFLVTALRTLREVEQETGVCTHVLQHEVQVELFRRSEAGTATPSPDPE